MRGSNTLGPFFIFFLVHLIMNGLYFWLFLFFLIGANVSAAKISGTLHDSNLKGVISEGIVLVDTTPVQVVVVTDGNYSFEIDQSGRYIIKAHSFDNNRLIYAGQQVVHVAPQTGDFRVDLVLFPVTDQNHLSTVITETTDSESGSKAGGSTFTELPWIVAGLLVGAGTFLVGLWNHRKNKTANGSTSKYLSLTSSKTAFNSSEKKFRLHELNSILAVLDRYGGRMTQKDLREKLSFGEAQLSLMLSELEFEQKIKKFKKGRGNIIILRK